MNLKAIKVAGYLLLAAVWSLCTGCVPLSSRLPSPSYVLAGRQNPDSYYLLACFYQKRGEHKRAIEEFTRTLDLDPNYAEAYNGLGISCDRMKEFSMAVAAYQRALALNPGAWQVYNNLGYSYLLQGLYDEAIDTFKKALAIKSRNPRLHKNLSLAYARAGRHDLAEEELKLADSFEASGHSEVLVFQGEQPWEESPETCPSPGLSRLQPEEEESRPAPGLARFGCIAPLSGSLARHGEKMLRGIELAIDEYNHRHGATVRVIPFDSKADPSHAQRGVRHLAAREGVAAVIGPLLTSTALSASRMAEQLGIPLFTPAAAGEGLTGEGRFVFRNCMTSRQQVETLAGYAVKEMGLTRFGILFPLHDYGREMSALFAASVRSLGGRVVMMAGYDPEATDFRQQLIRVHQIRTEALFLPDSYKKIVLIAPQVIYYGPEEQEAIQLFGPHGWYHQDLIEEGGPYVEGAIVGVGFYTESTHPVIRSFVSQYLERYGEPPDLISAQAYDAANILLSASDGGQTSWETTRERLSLVKNYDGVSGRTTILAGGESKKEITLLQIKDRRFIPLKQDHASLKVNQVIGPDRLRTGRIRPGKPDLFPGDHRWGGEIGHEMAAVQIR